MIFVQQVLFCYEPYDELVLMQLQQFDKKTVTSVEKEMRSGPAEETVVTAGAVVAGSPPSWSNPRARRHLETVGEVAW